jgi:tetratricopeptide (TPR) repeat protein
VSPALRTIASVLALACVTGPACSPARTDEPPAPPAPPTKPADPAAKPRDPTPPQQPLSPEEADVLLRRGERNLLLHGLSLDARYLGRATADFRALAAGLPADADASRRFNAWFSLAFALAQADAPDDPAKAREAAREILSLLGKAGELQPEFPGLWIVDGMARERAGEGLAAVDSATRGLEALAKYRGMEEWRVRMLRLFGLLARGRARLDPALGQELQAERDFEEAAAAAEEALGDPLAPRENYLRRTVLTHLAAVQQRLEYFAKAERTLEVLLREDPASFINSYNMAVVKARQSRFPEAMRYYRQAAQLAPRDSRPHLKMAFILLHYPESGDPDLKAAAAEAEAYLALTGARDAEYCALRGVLAEKGGHGDEAEKWYRAALALDPRCVRSIMGLVQILGRRIEDLDGAQRKELEDLRRRLQEGEGGENEKEPRRRSPDATFC